MSEDERLSRPPVSTAEFNQFEQQGRDAIRQSQELAMSPDFDPARDIAPLRQQFFSDLGNSALTSREQEMISRRYVPQFSTFDTGQDAFLKLQAAQQTQRDKRRAASLAPIAAQRVRDIFNSGAPLAEQQSQLSSLMLEYPESMASQPLASIFNSAAESLRAQASLKGQGSSERISAARGFATLGVDPSTKIPGFGDTPLERAIIEQSKAVRAKTDTTSREKASDDLTKALQDAQEAQKDDLLEPEALANATRMLALTLSRFYPEESPEYISLIETVRGEDTFSLTELQQMGVQILLSLRQSNLPSPGSSDPQKKYD
tara:strand:+ start:7242 stop:8192 length:951 start_codon:yes stop_codon:yes gene_type:complete